MKKVSFIAFFICLISSCLQQPVNTDEIVTLKKALIRSRNVVAISENIDSFNSVKLYFDEGFENQLIELNIEVMPISTAVLTALNNNGESLRSVAGNSFYGGVDILLNGNSIKSCLISQCQNQQCSNTLTHDFTGEFKTDKIYLNLTKLFGAGCTEAGINLGANKIEIVHVQDTEGPNFQGKKVRAQVISYNLTYTPKGMKNVIE